MKKIGNLGVIIAFIVLLSGRAVAGEPTAQLSATINDFVTILIHPPAAQFTASGLPENAMALVLSRFDFSEMRKRSLGSHWQALAGAGQRGFCAGFFPKTQPPP